VEDGYPQYSYPGNEYYAQESFVSIVDKLGDMCSHQEWTAKNSTLDKLSLHDVLPSDDDGAVSARNALSFLRANSTLKSLISFAKLKGNHMFPAFRFEAVK
jgi:hypothetical protein